MRASLIVAAVSDRRTCFCGSIRATLRDRRYKLMTLLLTGMFFSSTLDAAEPATIGKQVRGWRTQHEREILTEFADLLAIPNLASDTPNMQRNAETIRALCEKRGLTTQLLSLEGAPPIVVADYHSADARRTIAFYAHYDGQPVDPARWKSDPWKPVMRDASGNDVDWQQAKAIDPEWRLYARSAGDDKAPIVAMLAAIDALRSANIKPSVNLRFIFEGEEEAGSPHLSAYLNQYPKELRPDAWILCDGPVHQSRRAELFFGARGTIDLELTVYGPVKGLHDGHYGNWVPNPIVRLTHLIDSMRDENGRILIKDFDKEVKPPTAAERAALEKIPNVETELRREFQINATEGGGKSLNELLLRPALNVRGIQGGHVGEQASNTIQTEASASIDFRLVPSETPDSIKPLVEHHLEAQGYKIVRDTPDAAMRLAHAKIAKVTWGAGYPPARTALDLPLSREVATIMGATGHDPVRLPTVGGSIPMYLFQQPNETPVIGLPIANHDDNQHAADENLRLQNLWDGIEIYAALFAGLSRD
jgi:acetylornithine deacetylase/succinyl-diaminopimelate desuccinylase-like protein